MVLIIRNIVKPSTIDSLIEIKAQYQVLTVDEFTTHGSISLVLCEGSVMDLEIIQDPVLRSVVPRISTDIHRSVTKDTLAS